MKLVFFNRKGIFASLVRWRTNSEWSHVGILLGEDYYDAYPLRGVCKFKGIQFNDGDIYEVFDVNGPFSSERITETYEFLNRQVGRRYAYELVLHIFLGLFTEKSRKWWGSWDRSEYAFVAAKKAGVSLLDRIDAWQVTPGMLYNSPLLVKCQKPC